MIFLLFFLLDSGIDPHSVGHDQYINEKPLMGAQASNKNAAQQIMQRLVETQNMPLAAGHTVFNNVNLFDGYTVLGAKIHDKNTLVEIQKTQGENKGSIYRLIVDTIWQKANEGVQRVVSLWHKLINNVIDAYYIAQARFGPKKDGAIPVLRIEIKPESIGQNQYINKNPVMGAVAPDAHKAQKLMERLLDTEKIPLESAHTVFHNVSVFQGYKILQAKICQQQTIFHVQPTGGPHKEVTYRVLFDTVWEKTKETVGTFVAAWKKTLDSLIQAYHVAKDGFSVQPAPQNVAETQDVFTRLSALNPESTRYIDTTLKPMLNDVWAHYEGKTAIGGYPIKLWQKTHIADWHKAFIGRKDRSSRAAEVMAVMMRAAELVYGYQPRATQLVSVLACLLKKGKGQFLQVKTGEGKSLITAMLACAQHLVNPIQVDIVSSSIALAQRDAEAQKDFFDTMCVSSGCIGARTPEDNTPKLYRDKAVLYSDISMFMGDILKEAAMGTERRGKRACSALIVDELDSSLVDCITTILRLSTTAPGAGTLVPILQLLWARLLTLSNDLIYAQDKGAWVYQPTGLIVRDKLAFLHDQLIDFCTGLIKDADPKFDLPIADNLKVFAQTQIPQWVRSAIGALYTQEDTDYIYKEHDDEEPGTVKIVDSQHTGVVQEGLEWSNGRHQLIAIKHGGRLYPETSTGAYISRPTFLKHYGPHLYGMTGTLGDPATRQFLTTLYPVDLFSVPPYKPKRFEEYQAVVCADQNDWEEAILQSITKATNKNRGVLVICETIKSCHALKDRLSRAHPGLLLRVYSRSDKEDNKQAVDQAVRPKEVILSTNLGGRGTDIPITDAVERQGGLHVVVTFMPLNQRVEEQAFGRSARKGQPGSAQLVVHDGSGLSIEQLRRQRDKKEARRIQGIANQLKAQGLHDELFKKVNDYMAGLRDQKNRSEHPDKDKLEQLDFLWCMLYHRISHYKEQAEAGYKKYFQSVLDSRNIGLGISGEIESLDHLFDVLSLSESERALIMKQFLGTKNHWSDGALKTLVQTHFDFQKLSPDLFKTIARISGRTLICVAHDGLSVVYRGWGNQGTIILGLSNLTDRYTQYLPDLNVLKDFYPQSVGGSPPPPPKAAQFINPVYSLSSHDGRIPSGLLDKLMETPAIERSGSVPVVGQKYDDLVNHLDAIRAQYEQDCADAVLRAESRFLHQWVDAFLSVMKGLYPDDERFLFIPSSLIKRARACKDNNKAMRLFQRAIDVDKETFSVTGYKERADYMIKNRMPDYKPKALADLKKCSNGLEKLIQRWLMAGLFMGEHVENKAVARQIEQRIDSFSDMKATVDHNIEILSKAGTNDTIKIEEGQSKERQERILERLSTNKYRQNSLPHQDDSAGGPNKPPPNKDQTEIIGLGLHDFNVYSLVPPKPSFWERAMMAFVGIVQTVVGAVMNLSGMPIGFDLMMSGLQDIWAVAKSFVTDTLDWGQFWMRKGIAALTSAISHGYGAIKDSITGTAATRAVTAPTLSSITRDAVMRTIVDAGKVALTNTLISEVSTKAAQEIVLSLKGELKAKVSTGVEACFQDKSLEDAFLQGHFLHLAIGHRAYTDFINEVRACAQEKQSQIFPIVKQITQACLGQHHKGLLSVVISRMMDVIGYAQLKQRALHFMDEFVSTMTRALHQLKQKIPPIADVIVIVHNKIFPKTLTQSTANQLVAHMRAQGIISGDRPYLVHLQPGFKPKTSEGSKTLDELRARQVPVDALDRATDVLLGQGRELADQAFKTVLTLFDTMHHYSYKKKEFLQSEKDQLISLGTAGLTARTQESVAQLTELGINTTRDAIRALKANIRQRVQQEEAEAIQQTRPAQQKTQRQQKPTSQNPSRKPGESETAYTQRLAQHLEDTRSGGTPLAAFYPRPATKDKEQKVEQALQRAASQFGLTPDEHREIAQSEIMQTALIDIVDNDISTCNPIAKSIMQQANRLGMQAWQYVTQNPLDIFMHVVDVASNIPHPYAKTLKAVSGAYRTVKFAKAVEPALTKMQTHFSKMDSGQGSGKGPQNTPHQQPHATSSSVPHQSGVRSEKITEGNLDWGSYNAEQHIQKSHGQTNLQKKDQGIFFSDPKKTVEKAWVKVKEEKIQPYRIDNTDVYIVPYNNSGYSRGFKEPLHTFDHITIVTESSSQKLITAYPSGRTPSFPKKTPYQFFSGEC